jgi:SAM-dependent methyltransferase
VSTLSAEADWGNVRHAKPLRLNQFGGDLFKLLDSLNDNLSVLDVGSSRGHFREAFKRAKPKGIYQGIEPDRSVAENYEDIIPKSFSNAFGDLEPRKFDFLFLNHTLEHLDDPRGDLEKMRDLSKPESIIWIDVPDLMSIRSPTNVEEFFIDKHVTHFTLKSLKNLLLLSGWHIESNFSQGSNITVTAKPAQFIAEPVLEVEEAQELENLILDYKKTLEGNLEKLSEVGRILNSRIDNSVIFGAGRILDSLIKRGGLEIAKFTICDNYLWKFGSAILPGILNPAKIDWNNFQQVFILGSSSAEEIRNQLKSEFNFRGSIKTFDELLQSL